jgi:pimeloyl-ACP methyl ester carboxylesterase
MGLLTRSPSVMPWPLRRPLLSPIQRNSLLLTACDCAEHAYAPQRVTDVFLTCLKTDTSVAVVERVCNGSNYLVIAFCGSESFTDWIHNLMVWMARFEGVEGRVHAGFPRQWRSVSVKLLRVVRKTKPRRVLITGHSLGGAIASIAFRDIARVVPGAHIDVVTFGSPQCADIRFNSISVPRNVRSFIRCVHEGDLVQLCPPLPGYSHPQFADVLVVRGGRISKESGYGAYDHVLSHQLFRIWRGKFRLSHHELFEYRKILMESAHSAIAD